VEPFGGLLPPFFDAAENGRYPSLPLFPPEQGAKKAVKPPKRTAPSGVARLRQQLDRYEPPLYSESRTLPGYAMGQVETRRIYATVRRTKVAQR
jgi:hypothetical protein